MKRRTMSSMAKVGRLPPAPQIEDEAVTWVARLDSGPLDERTAAEFERWHNASPVHKQVYARYSALWVEFDGLSARRDDAMLPVANDSSSFLLNRRAVAATIAAAIVGGAGFWGYEQLIGNRYRTDVGEQRTVALADGSRVTLNTNTSLHIEFSAAERRIIMGQGEALFEVSHDPRRPFIVASAAGSVRAVGTKFVVRLKDAGGLDVLVTEGKVLVSKPVEVATAITRPSPAPVSAGEQLKFEGSRVEIATVSEKGMSRELAWRQGDIIFSGEPLSEAAAEMQRYTTQTLSVDKDVAHYSVGGYFRTYDIDAFIETVEAVFPVKAERSGNQIRFKAVAIVGKV
jgi:transmembrane sensor